MSTPIWLRQTWLIARKDLRRELRSRELTLTTTSFSVLLSLIFVFALQGKRADLALLFPGVLWVSILFAGSLSVPRTFADERESGCLRALAMIPGTAQSLYLGKLLVSLFFMALFESVLVPLLLLAFDLSVFERLLAFAVTLGAGTLGFAALGTLLSAMLVHHRLRDVLLPLILYPLLVPVIICGVEATALVLSGSDDAAMWSWIRVMLAADALYLAVSMALFGWVLRAVE